MTTTLQADLDAALKRAPAAALGRLLTAIERGELDSASLTSRAVPANSHTVGITGAPGAGKSTLASRLTGTLRATGSRVAVLAVDPSSPSSGGAFLGDRIRMLDHAVDHNVFIRSLATRGHAGGLAVAAPQAIHLLRIVGFEWILLETVGVGQIELAVSALADTVVVVVNPGWGDNVQAAKAGLMEIADIFVINKADRDGVRKTCRDLRVALRGRSLGTGDWDPPIVETIASQQDGIEGMRHAIEEHRGWLERDGRRTALRKRQQWIAAEELFIARLRRRALAEIGSARNDDIREQVLAGLRTPEAAADLLLARLLGPAVPALPSSSTDTTA